MNELGDTGHKLSGPGFENALRTCLLSGVILLDTKSGFATLTREASQILGLSSDSNIQLPIENLPPSLRDIARHVLAAGKPSSSQQVTIPTRLGTTNAHVSAVPLNTVSGNSTAVLTLLSINSNAQFIRQIRQLDRL